MCGVGDLWQRRGLGMREVGLDQGGDSHGLVSFGWIVLIIYAYCGLWNNFILEDDKTKGEHLLYRE